MSNESKEVIYAAKWKIYIIQIISGKHRLQSLDDFGSLGGG